jgi:peptidoglycan/xylan/chitin deacetylase (PgdA/CDA1 family)
MSLPILCYHKVGSEAEEGRSLNIEPERLEQHIAFLKRRGLKFILAQNLAKGWSTKSVCLTFDDAYLSALTYGKEAMLRQEVRGVYYVVSSLVGETSAWDGDLARPLAGWDLLNQAAAEGFELGNHTSHHPRLAELSLDKQRQTIRECQSFLAAQGVSGSSFCYPYGSLNEDSLRALSETGYSVGMALGKRFARESDSLLKLPRIVMAFSDSLPMLYYKLYVKPALKRG